jgi:1-acyl-sn-glycerol-3-phosphate acyltransferase
MNSMRLKTTRFLIRLLLRLLTHTEASGKENIPLHGNFVIASNHLGMVDAFLPFYLINNNNLVLLVGEKWEKVGIMRWLGKRLNFVFVDRFHPDIRAIRKIIARMKSGEVLVIAPEGTRSKVGHLLEGKQGVGYLAAKMGYPIIPVGISGTFDRDFFGQLKRFKRPHIKVSAGKAFTLSLHHGHGRSEALARDTDEIMCRIAAQLPPELRGFYANHPRLKELLGGKP